MLWSHKHQSRPLAPQPAPMPQAGPIMKNVLVLHDPETSLAYLKTQHLTMQSAYKYDSYSYLTNRHPGEMLKGLSTSDGIQFHHFIQDALPSDTQMQTLAAHLAGKAGTLDAIVIPAPFVQDYQNEATMAWLTQVKNQFPGVKILADGYMPLPEAHLSPQQVRFATPIAPDQRPQQRVLITPASTDYRLKPPIDAIALMDDKNQQADTLREFLGLAHYQEPAHGNHRGF